MRKFFFTLSLVFSCFSSSSFAQDGYGFNCPEFEVIEVNEFGVTANTSFGDGTCWSKNGQPDILTTSDKNAEARFQHGVEILTRDYSLSGQGVVAGVWDADSALLNHLQLSPRVRILDQGAEATLLSRPILYSTHATHVSGTVASSGISDNLSLGMAPEAEIWNYDWDDDVAEMEFAASQGLSISNHSYGIPRGWRLVLRANFQPCNFLIWLGNPKHSEDANFGRYDNFSRDFDKVVFENPTLTPFVAAGNERGQINDPEIAFKYLQREFPDLMPPGEWDGTHCEFDESGQGLVTQVRRQKDGGEFGFDTISDRGLAKNVITIGAISDSASTPTEFSSFGPADDGRIKPDISANGDGLLSTWVPKTCVEDQGCIAQSLDVGDTELVNSISGTSMATPVVTGVAALLTEYAMRADVLGRRLFADELKALLVFSSRSPTRDGAPTYRYGWGILDAAEAIGGLIPGNQDARLGRLQIKKSEESIEVIEFFVSAGRTPRAVAVWIDQPGVPELVETGALDDRTAMLVDDLDFQLIGPDGEKFFPWKLSPNEPLQPATRNGLNTVDSVEVIDVADGESGVWKLVVDTSKLDRSSANIGFVVGSVVR